MPRFSLDTVGPENAPTAAASLSPVTAGAETQLWDPTLYTNIPAGDPCVGRVYHVVFGGVYGNRTTSSPTSLWTPRWGTTSGGTALGASGAVYSGAALTTAPLWGELFVSVRAVGTSGTVISTGYVSRGTGSPGAGIITQPIGGTTATVDTTVASGIWLAHTWGATNASNTLTVQWVYLKVLN